MLRVSRYQTDINNLLDALKDYRDWATLATFKSINTVAPCIPHTDRKRLYEYLLKDFDKKVPVDEEEESEISFYIRKVITLLPAFNVLDATIELPNFPEISYSNLTEITTDVYNIEQIKILFSEGKLPALNSLTLYHWQIVDLSRMAHQLVKLSLNGLSSSNENLDASKFLSISSISEFPSLKELYLSKFNVNTRGWNLPPVVYFDQCFIETLKPTRTLRNTHFTMIECVFSITGVNTLNGEYPSKSLRLEANRGMGDTLDDNDEKVEGKFDLAKVKSEEIEEIVIIEQDIKEPKGQKELEDFPFLLKEYKKLKTLRIEGSNFSIEFEHFPILENLVASYENGFGTTLKLPETLRTLTLLEGYMMERDVRSSSEEPREKSLVFPAALRSIDFFAMTIDLADFFTKLPRALEILNFYRCDLENSDSLENLPQTLRQLKFVDCRYSEEMGEDAEQLIIYLEELPESLQHIIIVGSEPNFVDFTEREFKEKKLGRTHIMLMTLDVFKLFCVDKSREGFITNFKDYYDDCNLLGNSYMDYLISVAFQIRLPELNDDYVNILWKLLDNEDTNPAMMIRGHNSQFSIENIRLKRDAMADRQKLDSDDIIDTLVLEYLKEIIGIDSDEEIELEETEEEEIQFEDLF